MGVCQVGQVKLGCGVGIFRGAPGVVADELDQERVPRNPALGVPEERLERRARRFLRGFN